jgi:hypothetical protein
MEAVLAGSECLAGTFWVANMLMADVLRPICLRSALVVNLLARTGWRRDRARIALDQLSRISEALSDSRQATTLHSGGEIFRSRLWLLPPRAHVFECRHGYQLI